MTTPGGSLGLKGAAAPAYRLAVHVAGIEPGVQQGEQAAKGPGRAVREHYPCAVDFFLNPMRHNGPGLSHNNPWPISHLFQIAQIGFRLCVIM